MSAKLVATGACASVEGARFAEMQAPACFLWLSLCANNMPASREP